MIKRLSGPKTHICWTPDGTPPKDRKRVSLVLESDLVKMETALEWYGEQAEAIARHMDEKRDLAVMACVTALALDKGDRAKNVQFDWEPPPEC